MLRLLDFFLTVHAQNSPLLSTLPSWPPTSLTYLQSLLEGRVGTACEASGLSNFIFLWIIVASEYPLPSLFKPISYVFLLPLSIRSEVYPTCHLGKNGQSAKWIVCLLPFVVINRAPCQLHTFLQLAAWCRRNFTQCSLRMKFPSQHCRYMQKYFLTARCHIYL